MGILDNAKNIQSQKQFERLKAQNKSTKKINAATYLGKDPIDGSDIVQVDGNEPVDGFRLISNKPISIGDRVSLRPSNGGLQRVDAKNVKPVVENAVSETEIIISVEALVNYVYFFFYSGCGRLSFPYSDVTVDGSGLIYAFSPKTGRLKKRSGNLALTVTSPEPPQDPLNSIQLGTTPVQNLGSDSGYDEIGAQIVGSFIDHTGSTGEFVSVTIGYCELGLKFTLESQKYLKEWDIVDEVRPILVIDKKIIALDKARNLNTRASLLTYLINAKAMQPLIDQVLARIAEVRIRAGNRFFGINSQVAIEKFLEPKLSTVPTSPPNVFATDEYFLLSPNMDLMKTALQNFIAVASISRESALTQATVKCTSQKERADALQSFIVANSFSNYFADTSLQPLNSILQWYYYREDWTTIPSSPIELELGFEGIPWQADYGVGLSRIENQGYFVAFSVDASGIPFGGSQYDVRYRWRKRGNTEWFSI